MALERRYWNFYWPLALMGVVMMLSRQFQNRALASYPDAKREIVVFALAFSTFSLFRAAIVFVPQMTNVLVRSRRSYGLVLAFTCAVCGVLTAPVALLALTPPGERLLQHVFRIDADALAPVVRYMRFFTPLVFIGGFSQFYTGLLVQAKRTGIVTSLQTLRLVLVIVILVTGWELGWDPVLTLSLSALLPACVHLSLSFVLHVFVYDPPSEPERETLGWGAMIAFFWPVALTSVMFSFSRPILYSLLARVPDGEATIAAVAVAFSLAVVFHSPLNRFRDLFVTFGPQDLAGVRRFMLKVCAASAGLMLLATATPVVRLCLRGVLNVKGEMLEMAAETFWPLCLIPLVVTLRNYYHGLAMVSRKTGGMGAGGVARNLVIFLVGLLLFKTGWLNHVTAASVLVIGFLTEALVVLAFTRFRRGSYAGTIDVRTYRRGGDAPRL